MVTKKMLRKKVVTKEMSEHVVTETQYGLSSGSHKSVPQSGSQKYVSQSGLSLKVALTSVFQSSFHKCLSHNASQKCLFSRRFSQVFSCK